MVETRQGSGGANGSVSGEKRSAARGLVTRTLEGRIRSGEYPPGTWLPTERALAAEFDVDRSTVRAALTDLSARAMIVRSAGRRPWVRDDFRPDAADGTPAARPALRAIAAALPQHPCYPAAQSILRGVARALRLQEAPHRVVIFDTYDAGAEGPALRERRAFEAVEEDGIGAVLLWHTGGAETLQRALRLRDERGVAVVFVDRCPAGTPCDFVGVDNRAAARSAVEHLLSLGHRRIACLSDGNDAPTVRDRVEGWREALKAAGIVPEPGLLFEQPGGVAPTEAVRHFRSLTEPPTALFCINDLLAHYFIAALQREGGRVPDDLSVAGFDDLEQYSPRPAMLTTMSQPFERIGERAAELALSRLETPAVVSDAARRPPPFQHILLPAPLVVRATTARLAAHHP